MSTSPLPMIQRRATEFAWRTSNLLDGRTFQALSNSGRHKRTRPAWTRGTVSILTHCYISNWTVLKNNPLDLHKNISDTAGQEDLVNIMQGQSHRHALNLQLHGPTPQRPIQAAPQPIKQPTPQPNKQPAKQPVKQPAQQPVKQPVQKPGPQPAPEPAPEPTIPQPKGNHPNPSPSPGRGGGVIGTRGRASKPTRSILLTSLTCDYC